MEKKKKKSGTNLHFLKVDRKVNGKQSVHNSICGQIFVQLLENLKALLHGDVTKQKDTLVFEVLVDAQRQGLIHRRAVEHASR